MRLDGHAVFEHVTRADLERYLSLVFGQDIDAIGCLGIPLVFFLPHFQTGIIGFGQEELIDRQADEFLAVVA